MAETKKDEKKADTGDMRKEDVKEIFSRVLKKLKSQTIIVCIFLRYILMSKLWLECQKCGEVFWVFSNEIGTFYPKNNIDYRICGKCETQLKLDWNNTK